MYDFMKYDFPVSNIEIALLVYHTPTTPPDDPIHRNRPSHGLVFMLGEKEYTFDDGTKIITKKNDIIYLPKNSNYSVSSSEYSNCYAINFNISHDISFAPFSFQVQNPQIVFEHFKKAELAWRTKCTAYHMKCKSELYQIIYYIQTSYFSKYTPTAKYNQIQPAIEYINNNYIHENITIYKLSSLCSMTPEYFRYIFKLVFAISPKKYINNLKLIRAKELLQTNSMTKIEEIAKECGYLDMCHFSREFKKFEGLSPINYKRSLGL